MAGSPVTEFFFFFFSIFAWSKKGPKAKRLVYIISLDIIPYKFKYWDRYAGANSADPDQTAPFFGAV